MVKQYCFKIEKMPKNGLDIVGLEKHILGLYISKQSTAKIKFKHSDIPFFVVYIPFWNVVCLEFTSKSTVKLGRVEKINNSLKRSQLIWKGVKLGQPTEFKGDVPQTWWRKSRISGGLWKSLKQRGPYFAHLEIPYKPIGAILGYKGKKYKLTPEEEEFALKYAQRMVTDETAPIVHTTDKTFNQNFWKDFRSYLRPELRSKIKNFKDIEWDSLVKHARQLKEDRKKLTPEEKLQKKIETARKKYEYSYAVLDGVTEKVGNPAVEIVGLFLGRGGHPKRGKIKSKIFPEDVTLNIGVGDKIPPPPKGHKWGKIMHDSKATWLARWKDPISRKDKYIRFAATGSFKGSSDLSKYEKARKLQRYLQKLRDIYMRDASSTNRLKMQLGTVLWLIDNHGVRPGDERKEDQADTVGASTLRVEQVKLLTRNRIRFVFAGKDSIMFDKIIKVPDLIYQNFEKLVKGRSPKKQIFNLISASSINQYLKQFDKGFSNKVFRTRLASSIMFKALKKVDIEEGLNLKQIKAAFNIANIKVANILNHRRTVTKSAAEALQKLQTALAELKAEKTKLQLQIKNGGAKKGSLKIVKRIESLTKRISAKEVSIDSKSKTQKVAINTSLLNYIDPRIVVSWAERQTKKLVPDNKGKNRKENRMLRKKETDRILKAIYSKTMRTKFEWAIEGTPARWNWLKSNLVGTTELEPVEVREIKEKSRRRSSRRRSSRRRSSRRRSSRRRSRITEDEDLEDDNTENDYRIILNFCKHPNNKNKKKLLHLSKVMRAGAFEYPSLKWLYSYTNYAVKNKIGDIYINTELNKLARYAMKLT